MFSAVRTERGADRRRGRRLARGNLELHLRALYSFFAIGLATSFSTCKKSSSTGVARPKIVTMTFSVFRSVFTSSTTPLKLANGPSLIRTWSPLLERVLRLRLLGGDRHLMQDLVDLLARERRRLRAGADEPGDLRRVLHHMPRVVGHVHLDQDVAREEPPRALHLAAAALLDDVLGRDQHLADLVLQPVRLHALLERLPHLVLEARVGVDDVPLLRLVVGHGSHGA